MKSRLIIILSLVLIITFTGIGQGVSEVPFLEDRVEKGELPPMEERIPEDPYVVETIERIGDYGGTMRVASLGVEIWGDHLVSYDFMNSFVKPSPEADDIVMNFAKDIDISDDMSTYTFHLREDARWSDGEPFDVEDIMFWYEDVLQNEELTPVIPTHYRSDGELMELTKIDDYTFEISFNSPQVFFLNSLVHDAFYLTPKHYLKKFHPEYTSEEKLEERMEEEDYDVWYDLFEYKNNVLSAFPLTVERPTLTAYKLTQKSSDRMTLERNPYYWKVDEEGNQLPYIDEIQVDVLSDLEVVQGKIMSGEIDFSTRNVDVRNYPMYREYEDEGNYRTLLWSDALGSDIIYQLNMNHEDPELRKIFQDKRFRQALSLSIDRDEINEMIYFGKAEPRQFTVIPQSKYYESEFEKAYAEHDPERAEELLQEMGLEKDKDGYWLREDGERISFTLEYTERPYPVVPNIEIVTSSWQELGIDVHSKLISAQLYEERNSGNMLDATIWGGDFATDMLFPASPHRFIPYSQEMPYPKWGQWFESDGEKGEEPPAKIKELISDWETVMSEPDEEKRIEMTKEIVRSQAENVWRIGTTGLPPRPIIANKNLRNVPEENLWAWDTLTGCHVDLVQMFFEGGKRAE